MINEFKNSIRELEHKKKMLLDDVIESGLASKVVVFHTTQLNGGE